VKSCCGFFSSCSFRNERKEFSISQTSFLMLVCVYYCSKSALLLGRDKIVTNLRKYEHPNIIVILVHPLNPHSFVPFSVHENLEG
jgi:hypothetical protein